MTFEEIQSDVAAWSAIQFPRNTPLEPLEGMFEEGGELAAARVAAEDDERAGPEQWRAVVDYEGWYEVSDLGNVRRIKGGKGARLGRNRRLNVRPDGYVSVELSNGTKETSRVFVVHRLVAAAFIGPCPDGWEVNHKDGNKQNNFASNLEYLTPSDNQRHAISIGLKNPKRGSDHPMAILDWGKVRDIRCRYAAGGWTQQSLADEFGVSKRTINFIVNEKTWIEEDEGDCGNDGSPVEWTKIDTIPPLDAKGSIERLVFHAGRLAHARLKRRQGIRGTAEQHVANERDAIGDIAIYLMDFAWRIGMDDVHASLDHDPSCFRPCFTRTDSSLFLEIAATAGNIASRFHAACSTSIPAGEDYGKYLHDLETEVFEMPRMLAAYAESRGWDFLEILNETWAKVSRRDWQANPMNAATGDEA